MTRYYERSNANVHRSVYQIAERGHRAVRECPSQGDARFVNATNEREIVFTKNATEGINLVAYSWGRSNLREGDVDRAHPHGAPRQHRPVAHAGEREGRRRSAGCPSPTTVSST
jgi:hypothetical protein